MNRHEVATLEEAQQEIADAFLANKSLEVTTAQGVRRFSVLPGMHEHTRAVHPTQLYSAIDAFLLCLFLIAYYPYRQHDGEVTAFTFTIHALSRFLLEIIRTDEGPVFGTGLSISQNISLVVLVIGLGLWVYIFSPGWPPGLAGTWRHGVKAFWRPKLRPDGNAISLERRYKAGDLLPATRRSQSVVDVAGLFSVPRIHFRPGSGFSVRVPIIAQELRIN